VWKSVDVNICFRLLRDSNAIKNSVILFPCRASDDIIRLSGIIPSFVTSIVFSSLHHEKIKLSDGNFFLYLCLAKDVATNILFHNNLFHYSSVPHVHCSRSLNAES